jgi:aminoglycoside phosphotransferase (APT) family kinase protein
MREDWPRDRSVIDLDTTTVEGLIEPLFPGCRIIEIAPVAGGLTNTNLRLRLAGHDTQLLLRFYQRSGDIAHREMALCHKMAGRVPVPSYLHYAPENPVTGHAYAIIGWIDAKSLQDLWARLDKSALSGLGAATGRTLAGIHAFTYPHSGYLDADLNVPEPMDLSRNGLIAYLDYCLVQGRGGARLGPELTAKVLAFAKREGDRVEAWQARACLVHGDFNPSNILVRSGAPGMSGDPAKQDCEVAAIIDWEFAFAATPAFDFATLLRPPFDTAADFIAGLEQGYQAAGGEMPADWQRVARITDLFSFADVLHHPETSGAAVGDLKAAISRLVEGCAT